MSNVDASAASRQARAREASVMGPGLKGQRLIALFLLGCVLLNYPLFALFDGATRIVGIPLLYVYVFVVWALLIALMAYVVERRRE